MTSGIGDPLAKSTAFMPASSGSRQMNLRKDKGADQASLGAMRTALGELEAAF
jgi:hypothetical protein